MHSLGSIRSHLAGNFMSTLHSNSGGCQQACIQKFCLLWFLFLGDEQICKFYKQTIHGHEHAGCCHIEAGVDHSDIPRTGGFVQEPPVNKQTQSVERNDEDRYTNYIKQQMDHCSSACITVRPHRT